MHSQVENEFVNKLDKFVVEDNRGDEEYKELFHRVYVPIVGLMCTKIWHPSMLGASTLHM